MKKIAKQLKISFSPAAAEQRLWKLDPPFNGNEFVITSAVITSSEPETLIFAADKSGKVTDWFELSGSIRGSLDHLTCISNLGYAITAD